MVIVPYVAGGLRPEVAREVLRQVPSAELAQLEPEDEFAYADLLRALWREPGDLVVCEQDVIPPPGAIRGLLMCGAEWCCHPGWVQDRYQLHTLQLARFSADLRARLPDLADFALAPSRWWRPGPALRRGEVDLWPEGRPEVWPTAVEWWRADSALALQLLRAGVRACVHLPAPRHLHDYGAARGVAADPSREGDGGP